MLTSPPGLPSSRCRVPACAVVSGVLSLTWGVNETLYSVVDELFCVVGGGGGARGWGTERDMVVVRERGQ